MCHEALKNLKKGAQGRRDSYGGGLILTSELLYIMQLLVPNFQQAVVDATTRNLALEWGTDYDVRLSRSLPGRTGETWHWSGALTMIDKPDWEFLPLCKVGEKWDIAMAALYCFSRTHGFVWRENHPIHEAYAFICALGMWFNIDDMVIPIGWVDSNHCVSAVAAGKFIIGASILVDGGLWMNSFRAVPDDRVRQLSRALEKSIKELSTSGTFKNIKQKLHVPIDQPVNYKHLILVSTGEALEDGKTLADQKLQVKNQAVVALTLTKDCFAYRISFLSVPKFRASHLYASVSGNYDEQAHMVIVLGADSAELNISLCPASWAEPIT
ncbi:hypothetical protein FNV43_RR20180 [Rhamnella rubrinervis]|uniref:Ubiquitin-like domain-containing protein n=1 Tax=Rhamnella rubrinervis TaxID=2594499 RepID=A0A8K0GQ81_9ROSA|nr:hypothetical protein FNV43_RR20180 [Rhamnella rubrinervis]